MVPVTWGFPIKVGISVPEKPFIPKDSFSSNCQEDAPFIGNGQIKTKYGITCVIIVDFFPARVKKESET